MQTFARIENDVVVELFSTEAAMADLFHPGLTWLEATGHAVAPGWRHAGGRFAPPPAEPAAPAVSLAEVRARLAELVAQVAALGG